MNKHFARSVASLVLALALGIDGICSIKVGYADVQNDKRQAINQQLTEFGNGVINLWDTLTSFRKYSERNKKSMSHEEWVSVLRGLGIEIPDAVVEETENALDMKRQRWTAAGIPVKEREHEFLLNLLVLLGIGEYDYDTGVWTPSSSDVYAFDAQIFDVDHMYELFLNGVSAIVRDFEPTDIQELIEEFDAQTEDLMTRSAQGKTTVSFVLHGNRYERELDFYGDWFNEEAIAWVNEVLTCQGYEGQIYSFFDGMQGLILFYGDEVFGEQLQELFPKHKF